MAKTVRLEPIGEETSIQTNGNILSVLLKNELNVLHECGGRECVLPAMFTLKVAWKACLHLADANGVPLRSLLLLTIILALLVKL